MGDCRIRILVARELLDSSQEDKGTSSEASFSVVVRIFSADATVRDVVEDVLLPMPWCNLDCDCKLPFPIHACLWDCTIHPPKDITDWALNIFSEKKGPKSKTLYDAGWFPSGALQIIPIEKAPKAATADMYTDTQYNRPTSSMLSQTASQIGLIDARTGETQHAEELRPSQVIHAGTTRFPMVGEEESLSQAMEKRRQNRLALRHQEIDRHRKLEQRIRALDERESKKNTTVLVKRMLIKSRCTGSKHLDIDDRVYLHCIIIAGDDNDKSEYRYFSRQDTVGRVTSSLKGTSDMDAELLIRTGDSEYRRLPATMRLYEAMSHGYIQVVDSVVFRCFWPELEEPTIDLVDGTEKGADDKSYAENACHDETRTDSGDMIELEEISMTRKNLHFERLQKALEDMDAAEEAAKCKKKKNAKTSATVRRMLIKGRAVGDTKRIPKIEDRFFLELATLKEKSDNVEASLAFVFLAKTDTVGRLARDCVQESSSDYASSILVPMEDGGFRGLSVDLTWEEVEQKGFIKPFDRVVVRLSKID